MNKHIDEFSEPLLDWFHAERRDLPWRRTKNPYYIWISEIMLQQTRVDTVIPYYERFLKRFPTVEALADAPEDDVLKLWEGLGYYSRARNLQMAVREVCDQYGGEIPRDPEKFGSLRGVGPYTRGAVMSIAYNMPEPAVDGNVMRVLSRYFLIEDDIMKGSTRIEMECMIRELIPEGWASDFNQALMDFGAMVCTPKSPDCEACPLAETCAARREGLQASLPVKKKARPPRPEKRVAALIVDEQERILIRRRPDERLLARMWELPHVLIDGQVHDGQELSGQLSEQVLGENLHDGQALGEKLLVNGQDDLLKRLAEEGLQVKPIRWFMEVEHTFSHIHWDMQVYLCQLAGENVNSSDLLPPNYAWISIDEMKDYAFPNVFLRVIKHWAEAKERVDVE